MYKINWEFGIGTEDIKNLFAVIKAIGVRSLDRIDFIGMEDKTIESYTGFFKYPYKSNFIETKEYIRKIIRNKPIVAIKLIRE